MRLFPFHEIEGCLTGSKIRCFNPEASACKYMHLEMHRYLIEGHVSVTKHIYVSQMMILLFYNG